MAKLAYQSKTGVFEWQSWQKEWQSWQNWQNWQTLMAKLAKLNGTKMRTPNLNLNVLLN